MARYLFVALLGLLTVSAAIAGDLVSRELVVYSRDIAEVREVRTVHLDRGSNALRLNGISADALPGSAIITVDGNDAETVSIAFTDHVLDVDAYWQALVGQEITVEFEDDGDSDDGDDNGDDDDETYTGVLRLVTKDALYFEEKDEDDVGELERIARNKLDDDLEMISRELATEPSFYWQYDARKRGKATIRLSYLTEGLSWTGEHRVVVDGGEASLQAGAVVSNETGRNFTCDTIHLVGGAIHLAGDRRRVDRLNPEAGAMTGGSDTRFGDLRRWTLPGADLLAGHDTRLGLGIAAARDLDRSYVYDATIFDDRTSAHLEFTSPDALPGGDARVYEVRGGETLFVGEDRIDDTPAGSPVDLNLGQVFDISAERIRVSEGRGSDGNTVQAFDVKLGNSGDETVTVTVLERLFGEWSVTSATVDGSPVDITRRDARTAAFEVPVPSGATRTLHYEIRYER